MNKNAFEGIILQHERFKSVTVGVDHCIAMLQYCKYRRFFIFQHSSVDEDPQGKIIFFAYAEAVEIHLVALYYS
jgi:hypothetical protein